MFLFFFYFLGGVVFSVFQQVIFRFLGDALVFRGAAIWGCPTECVTKNLQEACWWLELKVSFAHHFLCFGFVEPTREFLARFIIISRIVLTNP